MNPSSTAPWTFHGHSVQALDAKSRVTVPARWRFEGLEELLAVPDGSSPVLRLMPPQVLAETLQRLQEDGTLGAPEKLALTRLYSAQAFPCTLDRQGRLSLPLGYVQRLGFSGEVMLVGAWKHIEIWEPARWRDYSAEAEALMAAGGRGLGL